MSARGQGGFTIVETLIVLGVASMMLFAAVALVAGQQRRVEFSQSAQDIRSVIDQNISEVTSGFYPSLNNIGCTVTGGNNLHITQTSGTPQGTNTDCIFMGRVMQFGNGSDTTKFTVHTLAGVRDNQGTLTTSNPQAIDFDSARTYGSLRNGLKVVSMDYTLNGVTSPINSVAFINGLGDFSNGEFITGSQQPAFVPIMGSGTVNSSSISAVVNKIDTQLTDAAPVNPDGGVHICFLSGGTKQSALVTIGGGSRGLSAKVDFKNSVDCT